MPLRKRHTGASRCGSSLREFLKTGSNRRAAAFGPMAEVVQHSTQHLSDADMHAIAAYLKSLRGTEPTATRDKPKSDRLARGAGLYLDQCSGCHMTNGEGQPGVFPSLKGNAVVQAKDPETLVHTILIGATTVKTRAKPTDLAMPAFDWKLSDQDIADLATWVRAEGWGNQASAVSVDTVSSVRGRIRPSER